jgi:hypothetical protein
MRRGIRYRRSSESGQVSADTILGPCATIMLDKSVKCVERQIEVLCLATACWTRSFVQVVSIVTVTMLGCSKIADTFVVQVAVGLDVIARLWSSVDH